MKTYIYTYIKIYIYILTINLFINFPIILYLLERNDTPELY